MIKIGVKIENAVHEKIIKDSKGRITYCKDGNKEIIQRYGDDNNARYIKYKYNEHQWIELTVIDNILITVADTGLHSVEFFNDDGKVIRLIDSTGKEILNDYENNHQRIIYSGNIKDIDFNLLNITNEED